MLAHLTGALFGARNFAAAVVLGALVGLVVDIALRLRSDRSSVPRRVAAATFGVVAFAVASVYALLSWPWLRLAGWSLLALALGFLIAAGPILIGSTFRRPAPIGGFSAGLARFVALVVLVAVGVATLLTAGFLRLTEDRPVLFVDVTGETGSRLVHWTPPDGTPQEQALTTHHVLFRDPGGALVAEAWVYGDEVAVKGRVLRLSPVLNAAGLPNLFELLFAHNGWTTAERHNFFPHIGVVLPHIGPLSVHRLWRPFQERLLAYWERRGEGGSWAVHSATIESTYFPLVDPDGNPVTHSYRLVLTPGGLTSS